ncbi:MAG: substrate-binding domain-containing protein [Acidimicrobiaceae bacterium]|nr:substrate-binding domain-containing protein [Acidimicrobiaceae bacterium]MCY3644311.1 substrate-binding domain-containing protein [Acidimicrobiaceae bacterium]
MNHRNARARALAAALVGLALVAAACSDDPEPAITGGSDQAAVAAPDPDAGAATETPATTTTEQPATTTTGAPATTTTEQPATTTTEVPATTTTEPAGPPHVAELTWGNFVLADRIAAKLDSGDALNFVLSLTAVGEDAAAALGSGWLEAAAEVAEQHGIDVNARVIGPNSADTEAQAATIESLVASADIDCLAVEAANPLLLDDAIDAAVEAGVPTFAVSGDSPDSKRFAFYGIDAHAAGFSAGQLVGQWAADGGILVRRAAVLTGDAGTQSYFDLMRGFIEGFGEIHSGVEFVNGPADVESFGFEPVAVYDATEAWVLDNLDVDIVFHTDSGVEALARVMADQLLYGDMYAVGFHMSPQVADYIRERLVVASMVTGSAEHARRAGLACGGFLLEGVHETGQVVLEPAAVTRDNVDDTDWTLPESS